MSLKITRITNHASSIEKEKVEITVTEDTNLGDYELIDNSYKKDGKVSNVHPHPYRFPDQLVKKGDTVIVHTGVSSDTSRKLAGSTSTTYKYYRNSKESFWNDKGDVAKLYRRQLISRLEAPGKAA